MNYAEITMRSGAVVTIDVVDIRWEKQSLKEMLVWTHPADAVRRLEYVNADEIVAVVFFDMSNPNPEDPS